MNKILGAQPITGPSHERGGVDMNLNGLPVETEGGELLLSMANGGKVVLNASQQRRLSDGESIHSIMKTLPRYSGIAQQGTDIPPWEKPSNPFVSSTIIPQPTRPYIHMDWVRGMRQPKNYNIDKYKSAGLEIPEYKAELTPGLGTPGYTAGIKKPKIDLTKVYVEGTRKNNEILMGPRTLENELGPGEEPENPKPPNWFDEYNKNLKTAAVISGLNALGQGLWAGVDMLKNKNKPRLPRTKPLGYAPTKAILESPQPYLDAIKTMTASGLRAGKEAGMMPQELAQITVKYPELQSGILSEISKINTGRILGTMEQNAQNALRTGMVNTETAQKDTMIQLQEDQLRMQADERSKDTINKSMAWMAGLFGQYSQNKLTSNIMKDIYSGNMGGNTAMILSNYLNSMGKGNSPYYYPSGGQSSGSRVPVKDASGNIIEYVES